MSFARSLSDAELAAALEFNASYNRSETAKAIMQEAARRLRGDLPVPSQPNNHPGTGGYLTLPADYLKDEEQIPSAET